MWRQHKRLRIADIRRKLNDAPAIYPPPTGRAAHAHGWSVSAIRGILLNPLYTGYRVRNRRDKNSKPTHPSHWIWPDIPAHEPLITLDTFLTVNPDAGLALAAPGGSR